MTEIAAWKDSYLVGDEVIDGQHRELIGICQAIEDLAYSGRPVSKEEAHARLIELFEEFRNHFDEEMQLYRRVYRIDYQEHQQHHAEFLENMADIIDNTKDRVPDLKAVIAFTRHWFIMHIRFKDIPQFEEIRARGFSRKEWGL